MTKRIVYIPVEIKKREWIAKLLLALFLVESGYDVVIGDHGQVRDYALTKKNGVYIEKDMFKIRYESLKNLKKRGFHIIAWDEEGLFKGNIKKYGSAHLDKETIKMCDAIIAWGKVEKNEIVRCVEGIEYKIYVIGNPRLDVLRYNGLKVYGHTLIRKPIILVISNFDYFSLPEMYDQTMNNVIIHNGGKRADVNAFRDFYLMQKDAFPAFANGIKYLAKSGIAEIVVRPHPGENPNLWKRVLKGYNNVLITNSYDANFWIKQADVMVHSVSTTSIESLLMGKYSILYMPKDYELFDNANLEMNSSIRIRNQKDLLCVCKRIINGESSKEIYKEYNGNNSIKIIKSYIGIDKKVTCCENIVNIIDNMSQEREESQVIYPKGKSRCEEFYEGIRKKLSKSNKNEKFPYTTVCEVKRDIYRSARAWGKAIPFVYSLQGNNIFYISKKGKVLK